LGVAVASRLPIESFVSRDLGGGYGALRARLRAGTKEIDVYSARLESGEGAASERRLAQLFHLAEFVRAESSTRPFVLLGDLGVPADEKDSTLLLDLLEARDLCVSHGDEVCGRTLGDQRVDYAVIPYSSRPPSQNARAEFTDLLPDDADAPAPLHFGLRAKLDERFAALRLSALPPGRDEALATIGAALEEAAAEASRRSAVAGWIPLVSAWQTVAAEGEALRFTAAAEEVRSARLRDSKRD
jgi:hypothetical protein